jgi:hypothetical protein
LPTHCFNKLASLQRPPSRPFYGLQGS